MERSPLLLLSVFGLALVPVSAQSISAADAKNHVGEKATVCGKVADERTVTSSIEEPTFINLDAPYPHQIFTIVTWREDRLAVGKLPEKGSHVCILGLIEEYRGVPEIKLWSRSQLLD
jgi:DNA/RNA endonuclease YhcR with UshA esterase domain